MKTTTPRQHRRDERRHRLAEHVAERQQVQEAQREERPAPLAVLQDLAFDRHDVRQHVAVGDDDALGLGGRAGGEDDLGDVVAADRHSRRRRRPAAPIPGISCSCQTGAPCRCRRSAGRPGRPARASRDDDAADAREEIGRRRDSRSARRSTPRSRQPQNATIHSGRFSLKKTTLSPLREPAGVQSRGESARRARRPRVAERPAAESIVVHEEVAAGGGEIVEEVDQRVAAHG